MEDQFVSTDHILSDFATVPGVVDSIGKRYSDNGSGALSDDRVLSMWMFNLRSPDA